MSENTGTIRSLLENNPEYEKVLARYEQKIANAVTIMTDAEFWQEELDRIKEFINPIKITVGGDFVKGREFNFANYDKMAYDWIKKGEDWPLSSIFANARQDYVSIFGTGSVNEKEFNEAILYALQKGAANVLYEKFLKDYLRQNKENGLTPGQTIFLGSPGESYSVYELINLLERNGSDDKMIFEIHDPQGLKAREAFDEFKKRSAPYYKAFVNPGLVDQQESNNISFAARIKGLWYFTEDAGSNNYLGTGPTSVLNIRKFCFEHSIGILYVEKSFDQWRNELLGNVVREYNMPVKEVSEINLAYDKINRILKLTGNEFCRHLQTAKRQNENGCRDFFLGGFSAHNELKALPEVENRIGRTDAVVIDKKTGYRFIYEFKIYKETSDINKGLDQIINQYPTHENRHNGLVLLNRKKTDIAKMMALIDQRVIATKIDVIKKQELAEDRHTLQVFYHHPKDSRSECVLTILVFDIQD